MIQFIGLGKVHRDSTRLEKTPRQLAGPDADFLIRSSLAADVDGTSGCIMPVDGAMA
jgi:hypothetical protein